MWKTLHREILFESKVFKFVREKCLTTSKKEMPAYYRLEVPDWVHVIALNESGDVILVDQYRHGARESFRELVGGSTDPGEEPLTAAKRELEEETGFQSSDWECLGPHYPNPALQDNRTWVFLAKNCKPTGKQNLDPYEELSVLTMSPNEIHDLILNGKIQHSLMLASWMLAYPKLNFEKLTFKN